MLKRLIQFIFIFLPIQLLAQTSMQDSLYSIQEIIIIIGQPFQEIIPSQKLKGTKLEQLNAHSVADALRYFSGVQLKDYGGMGGLKTVDVRNMGSHHVGVFYDGIQLGNAQNGVVDLGKFSLDDMEEISLYNGQKSEIFQPAKDFSSASSIYLKSKRPRFKGNKKTNILARYKAGSIHLVNPSLRLEQKLSSNFNISLSGEYIKSGGEYKFRYRDYTAGGQLAYDTTATRKNSDIEAYRIEVGVYGVVANGILETKLYYYNSERGLPGPILTNVFTHGDRQADKNFFGQTSYTKDITRRYKIKAKAKFAYDYMHYSSDTINTKAQYENKYYQQEAYFSLTQLYALKSWWDVSLSTDLQWNKLNATSQISSPPLQVESANKYPMRYSAYVALASAINLGQFKAQANILGTFVKNRTRGGGNTSHTNEFTPAVFVGYQPFLREDFTIRAFYKRVFRLPTLNDIYYTINISSNLKSEYTNQYNIGASYNKRLKLPIVKGFSVKADIFHLDVTDKIVARPTSQFRHSMYNIGKVKATGIELSGTLQNVIDKVSVDASVNYSYTDSKVMGDKNATDYKHQIPYMPQHSASAILNSAYAGWNLNYSYIYVGERYSADNIRRNRLTPWYTHDLSLQKTISFRTYKAKATVEMNNIFNKYYDVMTNYPMPGRTFKFIVTLEI